MPKTFAKIRVGLLDHKATLGASPEAATVYLLAHLQAPISGPDRGCVYLNLGELADSLGWSKSRVQRAVRFLQTHPKPDRPWLVQVARPVRGQPGKYYLWNFDGEHQTQSNGVSPAKPNGSVGYRPATHVRNLTANWVSPRDSCAEPNLNRNARVKNKNQKNKREGDMDFRKKAGNDDSANDDTSAWTTVSSEDMARQILLTRFGMADLPEDVREAAITTALQRLEMYKIRYLADDTREAANG